eukprot:UN25954
MAITTGSTIKGIISWDRKQNVDGDGSVMMLVIFRATEILSKLFMIVCLCIWIHYIAALCYCVIEVLIISSLSYRYTMRNMWESMQYGINFLLFIPKLSRATVGDILDIKENSRRNKKIREQNKEKIQSTIPRYC